MRCVVEEDAARSGADSQGGGGAGVEGEGGLAPEGREACGGVGACVPEGDAPCEAHCNDVCGAPVQEAHVVVVSEPGCVQRLQRLLGDAVVVVVVAATATAATTTNVAAAATNTTTSPPQPLAPSSVAPRKCLADALHV